VCMIWDEKPPVWVQIYIYIVRFGGDREREAGNGVEVI